jgi:hypothetical protein
LLIGNFSGVTAEYFGVMLEIVKDQCLDFFRRYVGRDIHLVKAKFI